MTIVTKPGWDRRIVQPPDVAGKCSNSRRRHQFPGNETEMTRVLSGILKMSNSCYGYLFRVPTLDDDMKSQNASDDAAMIFQLVCAIVRR